MSRHSQDAAIAPSHETCEFCQIEIERGVISGLRKEAIARGTNAGALVRDLLQIIVADHLVDAILDDQSPAPDIRLPFLGARSTQSGRRRQSAVRAIWDRGAQRGRRRRPPYRHKRGEESAKREAGVDQVAPRSRSVTSRVGGGGPS